MSHCAGMARSAAALRGVLLIIALQSHDVAEAAVNAAYVAKNQAIRDSLFKNLRSATTEYTFDYLVIKLPAGTIPGINFPVPVSHIRFKSTVFFSFDKYSLEPNAEAPIRDLANTVGLDKSAQSILVVGHTDAIGSDTYNASLSMNRAVAVASKLRELGVSDKLLGLVPMGEAQPIATNRIAAGRAQNRRVEFFISDIPEATRKAIELIKFNPCHRNAQEVSPDQPNPECSKTGVRIPVYEGSTGRGQPKVMLDLGRSRLTTSSVPTTRSPLPNEIRQRPSLKEVNSEQ
jgi:outer membrane protein OmpA-like peptidoglycan-associated protein